MFFVFIFRWGCAFVIYSTKYVTCQFVNDYYYYYVHFVSFSLSRSRSECCTRWLIIFMCWISFVRKREEKNIIFPVLLDAGLTGLYVSNIQGYIKKNTKKAVSREGKKKNWIEIPVGIILDARRTMMVYDGKLLHLYIVMPKKSHFKHECLTKFSRDALFIQCFRFFSSVRSDANDFLRDFVCVCVCCLWMATSGGNTMDLKSNADN